MAGDHSSNGHGPEAEASLLFKNRKEGDMLMDAPQTTSWRELQAFAFDEEFWRARVLSMRQPRVTVEIGSHKVEGDTFSFTISS